MQSMFERLAKWIIRRHKAIIAFWIILLIVSVPALGFVSEVLVYEEMGFAPENVESQMAQRLIDDQFPITVANSTIMIVVESDDIASEEVRDFAIEVEYEIRSNPGITYLQNMTSVYSIYNFTFTELARQLAPAMHLGHGNLTESAFRIFSGPEIYAREWNDSPANDTVFFTSLGNYTTNYSAEIAAYNLGGEPASYAMLYRMMWNETFNSSSPFYLPPGTNYSFRGRTALDLTAPVFFNFTQPGDDQYLQLMAATWMTLDFTTWDDYNTVYMMLLGMMGQYADITNLNFLDSIYNLGPTPSEQSIYQFSQNQLHDGTVNNYPMALPPGSLEFLMSIDTNTTLIVIDFSVVATYREDGRQPMQDNIELVKQEVSLAKASIDPQLVTYVTGDVALGADIEKAAFEDVERIDPVTVGLVFLIIGLFFVSFVTPGIAVGSIGIAILISQSLIVIVGALIAKVHFSVLTLMLTAMLGAGTDYAIFLMARYREERLRGKSKEDSVEECVKWAGESITTSGLAVMISFGALSLGSFALVRTMGLTIMLGIGMALLVALTFIPSLLMTLGDRIFWPGNKKWKNPKKKAGGIYARYFRKSARLSVKYAKPITIAAILISIPAAWAVFNFETSFDFLAAMPETEASRGLEAMGRGFGEGRITPSYVVVEFSTPIRTVDNGNGSYDISFMGSLENLSLEIEQHEAIQQVVGPTRPQGEPLDYLTFNDPGFQEQLGISINQSIGENDHSVLLTVIPKEEPFSKEAVNSIPDIRSMIESRKVSDQNLQGAAILVGGASALVWDLTVVLDADFLIMAIVVIVADYFLLMFVLGSVLVPLRLILTILLSVSWTIAMTLLIFQVWLQIPVLWLVPWILFVIAMGLGMDYDIFLTTRIREEVAKGKTDKEAIVTAVEKTGGIITAAGLVMAGAFATMMLSSLGLLQEFGFALAFVILLDAMIVRIYLVPSVMILLEKWNWWAPGRLQRVRREEKKEKRNKSK
ncbi:MAG: MMPL family transporter [Methanobacteriota archaeon]|nr:MAG: MMPL family transporter [Euryarchaeota archaeon]